MYSLTVLNTRKGHSKCDHVMNFIQDKSVKYASLVAVAEEVLRTLPWPREFEKDVFHVPQFSSLTVRFYSSLLK